MKKTRARNLAAVSLVIGSSAALAQTSAELVSVENYNRAQTDVNFSGVVRPLSSAACPMCSGM
jgi:hypothetical protein